MVFFCQRNCYEKEYTTSVVSCKPANITEIFNGKKTKVDCFEVVFDDTILFPEGGGQPYDKGTVNGIPVLQVQRRGGDAIHYISDCLSEGTQVIQKVDWPRRHDHMQQHSAQHLISAIADNQYNYLTISWYLGEKDSYIELDTSKISLNELKDIECICNEKIRNCTDVEIKEFDAQDPKLKEVRTRGLPDDIVGPVRVVTIQGVDTNMCCGTHVRNLADLQAIKLLFTEKGKAGKTLLHFVSGARLINYLGECVSRERELNILLHCHPQEHSNIITKLQKESKDTQKSLKEALRDIADYEVSKLHQTSPLPQYYIHHRKEGALEYLKMLVSAVDNENIFKVLTSGEENGPGVLVVHGLQAHMDQLAKKLCAILEGKGGGKSMFTAKVASLKKRNELEGIVKNYFDSL